MFSHVLVVCIGNICRSPVGEVLLKHYLKDSHPNVTIDSAGIEAMVNYPADQHSISLMQERGIDLSQHRAKQITVEMVKHHDLILVMEEEHKTALEGLFPFCRGKVQCLGHWRHTEIADPYLKPRAAFEHMANLVDEGVKDWIEHCWKTTS